MLASFKRQFGPTVLLQLNMAFFLPSIPVLFLQTLMDPYFDRKFGLPRAMSARMSIGRSHRSHLFRYHFQCCLRTAAANFMARRTNLVHAIIWMHCHGTILHSLAVEAMPMSKVLRTLLA